MRKKAFLLINTSLGKEDTSYVSKARSISSLLSKVDEVKSCWVVAGAYQIIAEIESDGLSQIGQTVSDNVKAIPDVERCTVCLVLDEVREERNDDLDCLSWSQARQ